MRLVLVLVLILAACSTHQAPTAPEVIDDQTVKLSYVSKPSANGTRCMFDRPGLLYWSDLGIVATVLDKGQWIYWTYTWAYIGIDREAGWVSYGINNGRITFPGALVAIWDLPRPSGRSLVEVPGLCSPASSVADLLAEINASLRAIKDKLDEEGLAGTAAGDGLVRSYNEVLDLVYERSFERLVEACRLAGDVAAFD